MKRRDFMRLGAGLGAAVYQRDVRIAFLQQGIGESHANSPAANDEVVRLHKGRSPIVEQFKRIITVRSAKPRRSWHTSC